MYIVHQGVSQKTHFLEIRIAQSCFWSWGQQKIMSENAFLPNMSPSPRTGTPTPQLQWGYRANKRYGRNF